jgi:hypothetical protein
MLQIQPRKAALNLVLPAASNTSHSQTENNPSKGETHQGHQ